MARAAITGIVGLTAGFALGVLVRGCDPPAPDPADAATRTTREGAATPVTSPRARARGATAAQPPNRDGDDADAAAAPTTSAPPPASADDADVREVPLEGGPTGWAEVFVEFVDAGGAPIVGQGFQLAAAGAPWPASECTGSQTGQDGRARFVVPSPATYDVQTTVGSFALTVRDVAVPQSRVTRIRRPDLFDVTVRLEDSAPPAREAGVLIRGEGGETIDAGGGVLLSSPQGRLQFDASLRSDRDPWKPTLAAGTRWHVEPQHGYVASPAVLDGPATVVVRPDADVPPATLAYRWSIAPAPPCAFDRGFRVTWGFDGRPLDLRGWFELKGGTDGGDRRGDGTLRVPRPRGTLSWSGPDIDPGSAPCDMADPAGVDVVFRVRDTSTARVRVLPASGDVDLPDRCHVALVDTTDDDDVVVSGMVEFGREQTFGPAGRWVLALPGDMNDDVRVGGPVRLVAGERHDVPWVRGGFVVVVPRTPRPPGAGELEVSRADGAPFVYGRGSDACACTRIQPEGTVPIGPFPPGRVVLDVRVGGILCGRYDVAIRAGEVTPLVVGRPGVVVK